MGNGVCWERIRDALDAEAPSLGRMLQRLRMQTSQFGIDGSTWEAMVSSADQMPAAMAAFPIGFELHLHDPGPRADLGVTFVRGEILPWTSFDHMAGECPDLLGGALRLSQRINIKAENADEPAFSMLEFDFDQGRTESSSAPGIFFYPSAGPIPDSGVTADHAENLMDVAEGAASLCGWSIGATESLAIRRMHHALPPGAEVTGIGVFPSRSRGIRMAANRLRNQEHITEFLQRVGLRVPAAADSFARSCMTSLSSARFSVHLDINEDGFGPRIGLGVTVGGFWNRADIRSWHPLFPILRDQTPALSDKLSRLMEAPLGVCMVYGRTGSFSLVRFVSHFKLVFSGNRIDQAKAYVYLLLGVTN